MKIERKITIGNIKKFRITKLFGYKDVSIPFKNKVLIMLAENGAGKTTILNTIYYTLTGKFEPLQRLDFDTIAIEFSDRDTYVLRKKQLLQKFESKYLRRPMDYLRRYLGKLESQKFIHQIMNTPISIIHETSTYKNLQNKMPHIDIVINDIKRYEHEQLSLYDMEMPGYLQLEEDILYYPTYRRIEEELKYLGYEKTEVGQDDNRLIQFGMSDVQNRIDQVTSLITNSSIEWFYKISGQVIRQLVHGYPNMNDDKERITDMNSLSIVLGRIGDNMSEVDKNDILNLVSTKEIFDSKYIALVYFLARLITVYDQNKEKDDAIKKFTSICNEYLVDKKIVYDESKVKIDIYHVDKGFAIPFSKLSSGEKQIVSIFSKIYLEDRNKFVMLFDEPELSLSIEWQRKLLPHIVESGKCSLMLATTHSPFIFENTLDSFATGMNLFIRG